MISAWWLIPACLFMWMIGIACGVILDKPRERWGKNERR